MKVYRGERDEQQEAWVYCYIPGEMMQEFPQQIVEHSPTGYEWGYGGSGPADLALNILADVAGEEVARKHHRRFHLEVVAKWERAAFSITEANVQKWLSEQEGYPVPHVLTKVEIAVERLVSCGAAEEKAKDYAMRAAEEAEGVLDLIAELAADFKTVRAIEFLIHQSNLK